MSLLTMWDLFQKNEEIIENIKSQYDITTDKELILLLSSLFYEAVDNNSWVFDETNLETFTKKDKEDTVTSAKSEIMLYLVLIGQFFKLQYVDMFPQIIKKPSKFSLDLCRIINSYVKKKLLIEAELDLLIIFLQNVINDLKGDSFSVDYMSNIEKLLNDKKYIS